jgi:hypothetical protein
MFNVAARAGSAGESPLWLSLVVTALVTGRGLRGGERPARARVAAEAAAL